MGWLMPEPPNEAPELIQFGGFVMLALPPAWGVKSAAMGLIRKTLMISTAGIVRGNSKKQRVAKSSLRQHRRQTALLKDIAAPRQPEHGLKPGWHASPWGELNILRFYDGTTWNTTSYATIIGTE